MLPVMAMGLAMFFGMRISHHLGEHRNVVLSLIIIGLATASRLFLDSAAELILSAVLAGIGIALIQALLPALIKSRFSDNVSLFMGHVTSIMAGAAIAASFAPLVMVRTGSWRIGLAIWAALAVVALLFWYAQRSAIAPQGLAQPSTTQPLPAIPAPGCWPFSSAWARPPTPARWHGWHRITWRKAGANRTPACCWGS